MWTNLRQRWNTLDPLVADGIMAVGLTLLVWIQIYLFTHAHPNVPLPPNAALFEPSRDASPSFGAYALTAGAFLPLVFRRKLPWLALLLSGAFALAYALQPHPVSVTSIGPMIAMYSFAAYAHRRHTGLVTLLAVGVIVAVPLFAFSSSVRWVAELVGTYGLITAAALFGDTERNRREYIAEVEARAVEAERTRDEEALRRVDEERIRIAREVHDIVAHSLSIVTVQASAAAALIDEDPARARESIEHVRATGKNALTELRSMLDVLRTGEGEAPLAPAADITHIDQLVARVREAGIDIDLKASGNLSATPAYASVSAYRIVQEALTNVVRHARATHVSVSVTAAPRLLTLTVADDGRGADPRAAASGGHGLRGMRERVEALGGAFEAGPAAERGAGFRVVATIPLTRSSS